MIAKLLVTAAALTAVTASSAATPADGVEIRKGFRQMFTCMVANAPQDASNYVLYQRQGRRGSYGALFRETCRDAGGKVIARVDLKGDAVKYGLADALILRDYRTVYPQDLAARPPIKHEERSFDEAAYRASGRYKALGPKGADQMKAEIATANFLSRFGECVVRANPAAAHAFLITEPATPAERTAFVPVRTALGQCIKPGQQFGASLDQIRGAMAFGFYRLAKGA